MRYLWLAAFVILGPAFFESAGPDFTELKREIDWVESTYENMTMDEQLGQLFMIRAFSKGDAEHERRIEALIREEAIGGLCFFQGSPEKQVELTRRYQRLSRTPLMISMDAEWGLGMRFKDKAISFPRQLTLGAIRDNREIYRMGQEVARQLKRMGVHLNFAPVVDINNNPENPVINNRSFGEDRRRVTAKAFAYMKGMQDAGVLACAKHFPGHGDTDVDSHLDLPTISKPRSELDSLELFPFKILAQNGIASVMIAHLSVPALDDRKEVPSSISKPIITDLLKEEIGFNGLVISDALDMKGMTKYNEPGVLEAQALEAGNDILLLSENVKLAKNYIRSFVDQGRISMAEIEHSVKKILQAKYRLGLIQPVQISTEGLYDDIISAKAMAIKGKLYEMAMTLVRDNQKTVPVENVIRKEYGSLAIGATSRTVFQERLDAYGSFTHFNSGYKISHLRSKGLLRSLENKDLVIVSLHDYSKYPRNKHGIGSRAVELIHELSASTKVLLVLFGSPYALRHFENIPNVLVAYETDELAEDFAAQAIFGVTDINGRLPVRAGQNSPLGAGVNRSSNGRLGYVLPEVVGLDSDTLSKMDSLARDLIEKNAAPGCQVLVAKQGRVVFHKAYGTHDYRGQPVHLNDVYDLASITKIAATTIAVMKLVDEKKLDISQPIKTYLPELDTSNKGGLIIADILAHHAQLIGWIPFYESTLAGNNLDDQFYRVSPEDGYTLQVCERIYLRDDYLDTIYTKIICSELLDSHEYKYSDLGFYLLERLVERISGKRLDKYCRKHFYEPLGLKYLGFNPRLRNIPKNMIPPTEQDGYYRQQKVQGFVHDMGAAMQSGVAGHAGLFSNAHDLAIIMQMLLNGGQYAGKRYLQESTINKFTKRHPLSTRRGLGFDMKELDEDRTANMCKEASSRTFGHLGFTGTATWADPENDVVFVFLSNRTYPRMNNNTLHKENYRPKLQSLVYRAMIDQ
ncbi:MAG: glycoside hydrolase family 3 N-terminal domain-containing protein [Saprospiraceae bacterium]|nr:glycoside hydrolase family 3 N-terminal domain-containing protein [Saprospiraceae bacterium]